VRARGQRLIAILRCLPVGPSFYVSRLTVGRRIIVTLDCKVITPAGNARHKAYMRFRLLREYVHISIAVRAVVEFAVYFVAFMLAAFVRFGSAVGS
jgi:hypothetical protein